MDTIDPKVIMQFVGRGELNFVDLLDAMTGFSEDGLLDDIEKYTDKEKMKDAGLYFLPIITAMIANKHIKVSEK